LHEKNLEGLRNLNKGRFVKYKTFSWALFSFLISTLSYGQVNKSQCQINWEKGQQLAKNHLWDRFEIQTKLLIKNCGDQLDYQLLYSDLAEAQGEQNKFKESLASSEKCLTYGLEPECHLRKINALKQIGTEGDVFRAKENAIVSCKLAMQGSIEESGCKRILFNIN